MSSLTPAEKQKLRHALEQVMTNPTNGMLFMDIANYHGAPYTSPGCPEPGCCPHGTENGHAFITWHRLYTGTHCKYVSVRCLSVFKVQKQPLVISTNF